MIQEKLFTKSAFKIAMACPWRLYYARNPKEYANTDSDNEFLHALAKGGFQVGALAKYYCQVPQENDLEALKDYDSSLDKTRELFNQGDVNIAEAAFKYDNLFVRVDVLQRKGNHIRLIEVKAKSWNPDTDRFISKDSRAKDAPSNTIASGIREYVYDVAFQKYVVVNALREQYPDTEFTVEAFLMMADKTKRADISGMNQLYKVVDDERGHSYVMLQAGGEEKLAKSKVQVLTAFPVDDACNRIIAGTTREQQNDPEKGVRGILDGMPFEQFVEKAAAAYCGNKPYPGQPLLGGKCFGCPYRAGEKDEFKSGVEECWVNYTCQHDLYHRPEVRELNGASIGAKRGKWIEEGIYYLDQITSTELKEENDNPKSKNYGKSGLDDYSRKWLQIGLATGNKDILGRFSNGLDGESYLDVDGLREEMAKWGDTLHMIDFETTAVALPYYEGMKPYEQVAFQFSHHIIRKTADGYEIEHHGQYLNEDVQAFPNFEFVRRLRDELSHDEGTIFRYATHENSILRAIAHQLEDSSEPDKEELIAFIRSITHNDDKKNGEIYQGERDMVDLLEIVKRFYYNYPEMHGSNSIKQVLPAVLNTSKMLRDKYSQPVYGKDIKSCNLQEGRVWIVCDENERVDSPYHQLPKLEDLMTLTEDEKRYIAEHEFAGEDEGDSDADFSVANGGAALVAYSKMMFCEGQQDKYEAIRQALLQYCELDTLAMVFIWEYFNDQTKQLNMANLPALKNNPMFQLSLASKELFHSNFLYWLSQDDDLQEVFKKVIQGMVGDKNYQLPDRYVALREDKNFDFCIREVVDTQSDDTREETSSGDANKTIVDEDNYLVRGAGAHGDPEYVGKKNLGKYVLILENKFKSIATKQQLDGYVDKSTKINNKIFQKAEIKKIQDKNNALKGQLELARAEKNKEEVSRLTEEINKNKEQIKRLKGAEAEKPKFILLTLAENFAEKDSIEQSGWKITTYTDFAEKITAAISSQQGEKYQYIEDYRSFIQTFAEELNTQLKQIETGNKVSDIFKSNEFTPIRCHDIWQKVALHKVMQWIKSLLEDNGYTITFEGGLKGLEKIDSPKKIQIEVGMLHATGGIFIRKRLPDSSGQGIEDKRYFEIELQGNSFCCGYGYFKGNDPNKTKKAGKGDISDLLTSKENDVKKLSEIYNNCNDKNLGKYQNNDGSAYYYYKKDVGGESIGDIVELIGSIVRRNEERKVE